MTFVDVRRRWRLCACWSAYTASFVGRASRLISESILSSAIGETTRWRNVARGSSIAPRTGVGYSISCLSVTVSIFYSSAEVVFCSEEGPSGRPLSHPVFFIPPAPSKIMNVQKRKKLNVLGDLPLSRLFHCGSPKGNQAMSLHMNATW